MSDVSLALPIRMRIGAEFVEGTEPGEPVLAPATGAVVAEIPEASLDQVDAAASARGMTRSAFLAQAAREKISG